MIMETAAALKTSRGLRCRHSLLILHRGCLRVSGE